jgi:hypothetical protein
MLLKIDCSTIPGNLTSFSKSFDSVQMFENDHIALTDLARGPVYLIQLIKWHS